MNTSKYISFLLWLISCLSFGCSTIKLAENYHSETLKIERLSDNTFNHISYLETETYGKVACNGMVVAQKGEAIIVDTPPDDASSEELINWVERELKCKVKAVVGTHFHDDCLGGLEAFHNRNIPSYALNKTLELANTSWVPIPQNGFEESLELKVGKLKVINAYLGGGHTHDNIVSYVPGDQVLFGGCLIKAEGAGKGFLGDADVDNWSNTVSKVKEKFGDAKIVIPGHGKYGGTELLDYTIEKFAGGKVN